MSHLSKSISLWQGVGLLVTTMMGTGVFVLPQLTAQMAGFNAIYAWIILISLMIPVTWVFGRLGCKYPSSGGPAHFVKLAFGKYQGQVVGLMFLLLVPVGAPAAIEITMQFVQALLPLSEFTKYIAELLFLFTIYLINRKGLSLSGSIQAGLTIAMLAVVFAIIFSKLGLNQFDPNSLPISAFELPLVSIAIGLAFWSFMGIETMSHLSEEFHHPERDFGRALNIGVIVVGAIYLVCTLLILAQPKGTSVLAMIDVFNGQFTQGGTWIIGILGIASGAATVNVYTASVARLTYNMSCERAIPDYWNQLNNHHIPTRALASILLLISVVLTITHYFDIQLEQLILWTNGVFVLIYLFAMLAATKLLEGTDRLIAHIASAICLILCISLYKDMAYAVFLVVLLSLWVRRDKAEFKNKESQI